MTRPPLPTHQTTTPGYDKLATLMALDPGSSIFRRFAKLNAKNLLYLQAELVYLQTELDECVQRDHRSSSDEKRAYAFSVWRLQESLDQSEEEYPSQWRKVLEARALLREYNEALLQQAQLLRFSAPDPSDLEVFKEWLLREEASHYQKLRPMYQWHENESDLIALCSRHEGADAFTRWVYRSVIPWFHRRWGVNDLNRRNHATDVWYYNNRTIKSRTYVASLLIAGFLPASSMIVLHFLRNTAARLVTIFVYNMVFVLVMGLMVKARKVDIFATATA
ncbi:uncharacterized protein BO66DRAFT_354745 [Aspergillus aculeatinus CBS 121060]|uniref:Uncharacterized protein n=1 Tax=Aspergillus aculeatinus CBS 121060 TaxID=1448322 RepID=A0ACD1H1W8_9EURO|nr:hypothetical protein BO66DRAFT_354745 [Aspergillus aculeatinus CBS 121060]RAH67573.1 hypothetical protein BO66DRAFT_354745 [Aspergillus aculeatinus CBS 121060]